MKAQRGLTLIELMVALAIFAVLGVLSYRALAEASIAGDRLEVDLRRWREVARTFQRIETDLLQVVPGGASGASAQASPLSLAVSPDGSSELQLLRLDEAHGQRRVAFRFIGRRLEWRRWNGRDATREPESELLLDGVETVRWRFLDGGQTLDTWPPASRQNQLPAAVSLDIELPGRGRLTRIFSLR